MTPRPGRDTRGIRDAPGALDAPGAPGAPGIPAAPGIRDTSGIRGAAATTVALVGAAGHGLWHRRMLHRLAGTGRIRVVGLCDRRPPRPAPDAPLDGIPSFTEHAALLAATGPEVVVVATPPHTHLDIALDAVAAGADLLLEKPPVANHAEHTALAGALRDGGRHCQVGFQALGSAALPALTGAIRNGVLGTVTHLEVVGAWWRSDAYFARTPWAGRRTLDGRSVVDGALVNPFAHALMQALVIAEAAGPLLPLRVDVERYASRPIEVDDTTFVRLGTAAGVGITIAVTLASATFVPGEITVRGTRGNALLEYPTDRLRLPGQPAPVAVPGRVGLLENLLDHRADPAVALLAPLAATSVFTDLVEIIVAGPPPARIPPSCLDRRSDRSGRVVHGIERLARRVVRYARLPGELSLPWAVPAHRAVVDRRSDRCAN